MLTIRKTVLAGLVLMAAAVSPLANAGLSANAGFVTDYYFRGFNLGDAGLYAGADFDANGFYVGTWWIDDGAGGNDGLETDLYFGYGQEYDSFSWNVGYNRYEYTYTEDYEDEIIISVGFGMVSLDVGSGTDYDESLNPVVETDYDHWAISVSGDVFGATYGSTEWDNDPNGAYDYIEVSAGGTIGEFDVSLTIGDQSYGAGDPGSYMFLDVGKSFDF